MKTQKTLLALTAGLTLALGAVSAHAAGNLAGQLNAQIVLQAGCTSAAAMASGTYTDVLQVTLAW
jgi:spore coat protein U-like protein